MFLRIGLLVPLLSLTVSHQRCTRALRWSDSGKQTEFTNVKKAVNKIAEHRWQDEAGSPSKPSSIDLGLPNSQKSVLNTKSKAQRRKSTLLLFR